MDYETVSIQTYMQDEELLRRFLSTFDCPKNEDISLFLRERAITFEKKHFARTYLVLENNGETPSLVGYFTLAIKPISLIEGASNKIKKLISGYSNKTDAAIYLIGQLAKNFANPKSKCLSGETLINIAIEYLLDAQDIVGGRSIMIECEDTPALIDFYEGLGFIRVNRPHDNQLLTYVLSIDKLH